MVWEWELKGVCVRARTCTHSCVGWELTWVSSVALHFIFETEFCTESGAHLLARLG